MEGIEWREFFRIVNDNLRFCVNNMDEIGKGRIEILIGGLLFFRGKNKQLNRCIVMYFP